MGTMRTLPMRPDPISGESFASYVNRLAAFSGVRLLTVLARTGVIDQDRHANLHLHSGYGVSLAPERMRTFCRVTRLSEKMISKMLIASYHGLVGDFRGVDLFSALALTEAGERNWVYFRDSHACPLCLKESGGVWKLAWKLPWSFACVRRRNVPVDTCPSCGLRLLSGGERRRCFPPSPSQIPVPSSCLNTPPIALSSAHHRRGPCGQSLDELETVNLGSEWHHIVEAQEYLDRVLGGARPAIAGEPVSHLEYFRDLKALSSMIITWGVVDDLGTLPPVVRLAFERHFRTRTEREISFRKTWEKYGLEKVSTSSPLISPWSAHNANLLAGVVPLAVSILGCQSPDGMVDAVSRLLLRIGGDDPVASVGVMTRDSPFSRALLKVLRKRLLSAERTSTQPILGLLTQRPHVRDLILRVLTDSAAKAGRQLLDARRADQSQVHRA